MVLLEIVIPHGVFVFGRVILGKVLVYHSFRRWEVKLLPDVKPVKFVLFFFDSFEFMVFRSFQNVILIDSDFLFGFESIDKFSLNVEWKQTQNVLVNYPHFNRCRVGDDRQQRLDIDTLLLLKYVLDFSAACSGVGVCGILLALTICTVNDLGASLAQYIASCIIVVHLLTGYETLNSPESK